MDKTNLKAEIQRQYHGPDQSSGGVQVLEMYPHADGTVSYLTSECRMRYFKNGRANMHTETRYSIVAHAVNTNGIWEPSGTCLSRYGIKTKREAKAYFKSVCKGE